MLRVHRWPPHVGHFAVAIVVTAATGCGSTPPLAPGAVTHSSAPAVTVHGETWDLTTTIVSIEGEACFWRAPEGRAIDWQLAVTRDGPAVRFLYDIRNWPTDHLTHHGVMDGQSFKAATDPYDAEQPCALYTFMADVTGSFSPDGQTLTASERWIYRLTTGSNLIVTFEWIAKRR